MSSKTPSKSLNNSANSVPKSEKTDGTVACFWSSSSPDWYDEHLESKEA